MAYTYILAYSTSASGPWTQVATGLTSPSYQLGGLAAGSSYYVQITTVDTASGLQSTPAVAGPFTTTAVTESPEATAVTLTSQIIYASRTPGQASNGPFDTFQITGQGGQVIRNGTIDSSTSNVIELYYHSHVVFLETSNGNQYGTPGWQQWGGVAWSACPSPLATLTISGVSLSNTTIAAGQPAGTQVGTITVSMSSGTFSGTVSPSDTTNFSVTSDLRLLTGLSLAAGNYPLNLIATQSSASNSPFTQTIAGGITVQAGVNVPGPPTSLASPSQTTSSIVLSWAPPTSGGALNNGAYQVQYRVANGALQNGPTIPYITPASGTITDSFTNKWAVVSSIVDSGTTYTNAITVNGVHTQNTQNVTTVLLISNTIYQLNTLGNWYSYTITGTITTGALSWTQISNSPLSTGVTVGSLTAGTQYSLQVYVSNTSGSGQPCTPITVSTIAAAETLAINNIANQTVGTTFTVQGTIGGLSTAPTLQYMDGTAAAALWSGNFSNNAWMSHRAWQSGDPWEYCYQGGSDGLQEGPTWWANAVQTPAATTVYQVSGGNLRLGLMNNPGNVGISQNTIGVLMNNYATPGGDVRGLSYHELSVAVAAVPGFLFQWDIENYNPEWLEIDCVIWTNANGSQHIEFSIHSQALGSVLIATVTNVDITQRHAYGINRQSDYITCSIDGTQVGRIATPGGNWQSEPFFAYLLTSDATYASHGDVSPSAGSLPVYATVYYYNIYANVPGVWAGLPTGSSVTATSFSFTHPAVATANSSFTVSVRDQNNASVTATSNTFAIAANTTSPPGAVTGLQSGYVSSSSVNVEFAPPTTGGALDAGTFQVLQKLASAGTYSNGPSVPYCTPGSGSFSDGAGHTVAITSGGQLTSNTTVDASTSNVAFAMMVGTRLWQNNKAGNWYSHDGAYLADGTGWSSASTTHPLTNPGVTAGGLSANTAYNFEVYVTNSKGQGTTSSAISVTTTTQGPPPPTKPPAAPTSFTSTAQSNTTITVSWAAPGSSGGALDAGAYQLQQRVQGTSTWFAATTVPYCTPGVGSFTDSFGNVWAINSGSIGTVNGQAGGGTVIFSMLVAGTVYVSSDQTTWYYYTPSGNITDGNVLWGWPSTTTSPLTYKITGLSQNTAYDLQINASNTAGAGPFASASARTTNSTSKTPQDVINFLNNLAGKGVISGQFVEAAPAGDVGWGQGAVTAIHDQSGQWVGLIGIDYYHYGQTGDPVLDANPYAKSYWAAGGLVTLSTHMKNPYSGGGVDNTNMDANAVLTSGTAANNTFVDMLNKIAAGLLDLQSAGVVVMYRPYHEMDGGWFWWGSSTFSAQQFIQLYRFTHDYIIGRGVNNVVWGWSTNGGGSDRYPGSAYVDYVGYDLYTSNPGGGAYGNFTGYGKPIAMTEFGSGSPSSGDYNFNYTTLVSALKNQQPRLIYWLSWGGFGWAIGQDQGVSAAMNDPYVINRGEITL